LPALREKFRLVADWSEFVMDIGAYEAKTHFSQLLDRVENGERITITKHGRPVAVLAPPESRRTRPVGEVIAEIRALRKGVRLDGLKIKDMIREGRP
jgi:prevent-host-death family protein